MPAIYIAKYNRFLDNILGRINKILATSYDPVRVKLQTDDSKKNKGNTKKNNTTKKNKKKTNKVSSKVANKVSNKTRVRVADKKNKIRVPDTRNKMAEFPIARATESEVREPSFILISRNADNKNNRNNSTSEVRTVSSNKTKNNKKNKKKNNNKGQTKQAKSPKAKATLYGLSSIRRDGDVNVNMMTNYTTVKTNFILGPLTLRVEKEVHFVYIFFINYINLF